MKRTARDILRDMRDNMLTVDMEATVHQAVKIKKQHRVGAILIVDAGRIVGIWTERDLLHRTVDPQFDPGTEKVSQSMTRALISAGDAMRANMQQSADEYRALNEMVSLEYYENWKAHQAEAVR
jgi:CBS domain-containing protein